MGQEAEVARHMSAETVAAALAAMAVLFGGWGLYLQSQVGSIKSLWRWKDAHVSEYNKNRLEDVEKFAKKQELDASMAHLESRIADLKSDLEKRLDELRSMVSELLKKGGG